MATVSMEGAEEKGEGACHFWLIVAATQIAVVAIIVVVAVDVA